MSGVKILRSTVGGGRGGRETNQGRLPRRGDVVVVHPGPHRAKRLRKAIGDPSVSAIVLVVDSPGGPAAHVPPAVKIEV